MRRFRKLLSLLLCLTLIAGVLAAAPMTVYADGEESPPYKANGTCGAENPGDVEWYAFDDNSMAFFGTGAIQDYTLSNGVSTAPWYGNDFAVLTSSLFVTKIAVEYGVTRIGDYTFYLPDRYPYEMLVQLRNVDIANTVTSIGKYTFYNQKIQEVIIPPSVTHIGANAFKKCSLTKMSYYGDPDSLIWDSDGEDSEFPSGITCHILSKYASKVSSFNTRFAYKHITFVADAEDRYAQSGEDVDRNIALYYGTANSYVFGGAAPYVIIGRFDGKKKSVTHGSNGFVSCVQRDGTYYVLTDTATGDLKEATVNSLSGKVERYSDPALSDLKLHITHEYIGTNTVKVIYTLENKSDSPISNLKVGGTGDIKIGADDFASIEPLNENSRQVGFYMKSTQSYDKSAGDDYATLGFIGEKVEKTKANGETPATYYPNAHFFYGKTDSNKAGSAAGSKTVVLIPERIFSMNNAADANSGKSQSTGSFEHNLDSGMSYYWDGIDLAAKESKQYAVLFSVYGAKDDTTAQTVINDIKDTYYTVTFNNYDGSTLFKQVVKQGDHPVYGGATPTKARQAQYNYTFSGWTDGTNNYGINDPLDEVTGDITYTATFTQSQNKLFHEHSITLHGDIGVNFFLNVTPEEVDRGVTVKFSWGGDGKINRRSEYTISQADYDSATGHYKAKCWVAAAEMTYNIHAVAWFEGHEYTEETDDYSVRQYGDTIIRSTNNEYDANLVDLAKKMLDYGAKAQVVFDRRTDDLANKNVTGYTMTEVDKQTIGNAVRGTKSDMTDTADLGLRYEGSSIVFLTKTTLRHYYKVVDSTKFTEEVKNSANFRYGTSGNLIYFDTSDIPASKLDELQRFTITDKDGNIKTFDYAVLNYCKLMLYDESETTEQEKALAMATYWYNKAANTYFND